MLHRLHCPCRWHFFHRMICKPSAKLFWLEGWKLFVFIKRALATPAPKLGPHNQHMIVGRVLILGFGVIKTLFLYYPYELIRGLLRTAD